MIALFFSVASISFLGSLHPGAVNVAVVQVTLSQSRRAGIWLALGGSLPEVVYGFLAAYGLSRFGAAGGWVALLPWLSIPVLLLAGLAVLFRRTPPVSVEAGRRFQSRFPFWQGLTLAGINPQLLPFWSAVWIALGSILVLPRESPAIPWVFALGTATGAFALLLGLVWLADRYRLRLLRALHSRYLNRLTGLAFIGMALGQAIFLAS